VPRKPRILVASGSYNVYCRAARVERCRLKVKVLTVVIDRGTGSASRLYAHAAAERRTDAAVTARAERVVQAMRRSAKKSARRQ
jgi:hypothetical protein